MTFPESGARVFARFMSYIVLVFITLGPQNVVGQERKCEKITIPMCTNIGYNFTSMPNKFHHETQKEAGLQVHQFWPLVLINCSDDLQFFLCSLHTPICMKDHNKPIPPCRSVCERAQAGCAPIMRQYRFNWPETMTCEEFPNYGDPTRMCMDHKKGQKPDRTSINQKYSSLRNVRTYGGQYKNSLSGKDGPKYVSPKRHDSNNDSSSFIGQEDCKCFCRPPMVTLVDTERVNFVKTGGLLNCAVPCHGTFFSTDENTFTTMWLGLWSVLCCISTCLTVITFLIDMQRFRYPERPIIFLSGCYLMVSIGYLVRLVMGHPELACDGPIVRYQDSERPAACTIVFLLIYFFGMASSLWWVILALTWLLAAGLKWGNEAIAGYSLYFHLLAWSLPTVKTIAILAVDGVDGDPVAGICFVGNQDLTLLRGFVLTPLCVYLLLGTSFLLAGFVALFRIRNVIRQQARAKVDNLEKLMIRIGVFSVLYTVPATIVIGCYIYEQHSREAWEKRHNCPCSNPDIRPDYTVFMLKYFMCLVVGITSGFWVWSEKTVNSWQRFYGRICGSNSHDCVENETFKPVIVVNHVEKFHPYYKQMPISHV
ncbi:frizzled-5-like [Limulus polyphemus]|uniref:Frizzled-5-like n=1 Tax=Limulus polyphemus TaxID=6850 RepID=A0ABM1RW63_LIMPO|nr:frizzled-5-like [Limulus polyphemus]